MFFVILMNINAGLVKKRDEGENRRRRGGRKREREKKHREGTARMICRFLSLFRMPSSSFPPTPPLSRFIHRRCIFCPPFSLVRSFVRLPHLTVFLGILFACGLVTAGRGESRARGESTLRGYSNFECVCPECKISPPSPPARRTRHPPCRGKEMSPRAPLTGFVTASSPSTRRKKMFEPPPSRPAATNFVENIISNVARLSPIVTPVFDTFFFLLKGRVDSHNEIVYRNRESIVKIYLYIF